MKVMANYILIKEKKGWTTKGKFPPFFFLDEKIVIIKYRLVGVGREMPFN